MRLTWRTILEHYQGGYFTLIETRNKLYECLTENNINTFLENAPQKIIEDLRTDLPKFPLTEEDWEKFRILQIGAYIGGTAKSWQRREDNERKRIRRGVELLRATMHIYTFILSFQEGQYISQYRGINVSEALKDWADKELETITTLTPRHVRLFHKDLETEEPTTVGEGFIHNVWHLCLQAGNSIGFLIVVKTSE